MGTKEIKEVKVVPVDKTPMDIRKMSALWKWTALVDGKPFGGPYQLPMVVRQLEAKDIKTAVITFDYKA